MAQNPNVPTGVDPKAVTPITPPELLQPPPARPQVKEPTDLPALTPAEASRYESNQADREGVIQHSLVQGSQQSPDLEAQVSDISKRRGVPADYVRRNLDHFKAIDFKEKAPVRKLDEETPHLAQWLTEKNNAGLAHDDLEPMGALEWMLDQPRRIGQALAQGTEQMNVARLRVKEITSKMTGGQGLTQAEKDSLNASAFYMNYGGDLGAESWFSKAIVGSVRLVPNVVASIAGAAPASYLGAKVGALAGPEGAVTGGVVGAGIGAFTIAGSLEGGLGYHELVQEVDDNGRPYDPNVALGGALIIGAINGGIELIPLERLTAGIPGLNKLTRTGARDAVKLALKNPTTRQAIAKVMKTYGITLAIESGTEGLQRLTNVAVDEIGKAVQAIDGAKFETGPNRKRTWTEMGEEVLDEVQGMLTSGALLPLPGAITQTRANLRNVREAQANVEFFKALGEGVTAAKTVERAPAAAKEFIERVVKDGPVENVYIPTSEFTAYWQSKNVDPREMATKLTGDAAAYDEALRDKVDLIVPMASYATNLAGTEHHQFFQDEIRLKEGQYNGREAKLFEGEVESQLKVMQEAAQLQTEELAKNPAMQEHGQVYDAMRAQLEGLVGPKLADGYAKMHEAFFGTMATRAGVGIRAVFDKYALQVGREGITPGVAQRIKGSELAQPDYRALRTQALAGGFTFAPLDETQPTRGFAVSAFPGREHAVPTGDLSETTIEDFIKLNMDALGQKGAHVGAWFNEADGKVYLDVSMVAETPAQAEKIARDHQQLAYYDLERGETVNVQTAEDLARFQAEAAPVAAGRDARAGDEVRAGAESQFFKREAEVIIGGLDAAPAERRDGALLISTRYIAPAGASSRTLQDQLLVTDASLFSDPEKKAQAAAIFRTSGLLTEKELKKAKTDDQVLRFAIDAMKRNLKTLHDKYPEIWAKRARHWYDGANRIANELADQYGVTVDQASGVLAALSPQMDWFRNVSLAERVLDLTRRFERDNPQFSVEMYDAFAAKMRGGIQAWVNKQGYSEQEEAEYRAQKEEDIKETEAIIGQQWAALDILGKAKLLRAWDELFNPRTYDIISPEGDRPAVVRNKPKVKKLKRAPKVVLEDQTVTDIIGDEEGYNFRVESPGDPSQLGWSTYVFIGNAISIALDADPQNISERTGTQHKVRSFFNNISHPHDTRSVTIDTHAVGAAWLQPFAGSAPMVIYSMGSAPQGAKLSAPKDAAQGMSGTNGIIAQAYFELAKDLNLEPRELQSITWEAQRSLFRPEQKRSALGKKLKATAIQAAEDYAKGKLSHDEKFAAIFDAAGGFEAPGWEPHPVSEQGALAASAVRPRRPTVAAPGGAGASGPGRPAWGDTHEPDGVIRGVVGSAPTSKLTQLYQSVWHGAARAFKTFDLTYAGTGEGNTTFGWGLYFASRRDIAEWYRDQRKNEGEENADAQLIQAEIPPDEMFLDWDTPLSQQSKQVRDALATLGFTAKRMKLPTLAEMQAQADRILELPRRDVGLFERSAWKKLDKILTSGDTAAAEQFWMQNQNTFTGESRNPLGQNVYKALAVKHDHAANGAITRDEAMKAASLQLAQLGLAGIRYKDASSRHGGTPSYNYVVVDEALAKIVSYEQNKRGMITLGPQFDGSMFAEGVAPRSVHVDLLRKADPTTFFHESGHLFFEVLGDIHDAIVAGGGAKTPEQTKILADYQTLLAYTGVTERAQVGREQHEKMAEAFEDWLMKGNAPSIELRSLFSRMRAWFMGVYQAVRGSAGSLTPEVEDVFARMLATDEAIEQARGEAQITPLFTDAARANMKPEDFEPYRQLVEEAHKKSTESLQASVFRDLMKRRADDYKARREEVRAGVETEVAQEPVYRALAVMRNTENPVQLSTRDLVDAYGDEALAKFPADLHAMDGIGLQAGAELLGFTTGDALVKGVANAPPMQDVVDERTDALMTEEFGDKLTDAADLHAEAQATVNGPLREQVVQAELTALTKGMTQTGVPPVALIRTAVERRLGITKVRNLKPGLFLSAAQRHSKKAFDLLAAGDRTGAVQAKRDELVALTFFRMARDAQKKVESTRKRLGAFATRPTIRQAIGLAGADYLQQIDGILDRYEFAKVPLKTLDGRVSLLKWAEGKKAAGQAVQLSEDILTEARKVNWQQLTTDELFGVHDAVEHIAHLSRVKNRLQDSQDTRDLDAVAGDVARSMEANRKPGFKPVDEPRLPGKQVWQTLQGWHAEHLKIAAIARMMDGDVDNGPVTKALIRPLNDAATSEAVMNEAATTKLLDIFSVFGRNTRSLYVQTNVKGLNKPMSRMARIMVGLNVGNADNRQRIEDELGKHEVQAVLDTLDGTDWAFIQNVWDHIDSYWTEIAEKQERVTGVRPEKVIATEVDTRFGKLRGGYFPIKYEPKKDIKAKTQAAVETAKLDAHAAYVDATTRRGHTEARLAETHGRKLRQDFGVITEHITQVIHDLTHHEALMNVSKVLGHSDVVKAFEEHHGAIIHDQFTSALTDIAHGDVGTGKSWEKILGHVRKGSTVSALALSFTTTMMQPFGLLNAGARMGVIRVGTTTFKITTGAIGRGIKTMIGSPNHMQSVTEEIYAKSPMMRLRGKTFNREVNEIRNAIGMNDGKVASWMSDILRKTTFDYVDQHAIAESYFWMIQKGQQMADIPTWLTGYQKAISEGMTEKDAIAVADQVVLDTQGGGQVKDLASVQRGSQAFKLFTNFYSYFSTVVNQLAVRTRSTNWKDPYSVGRLAADYALLVAIPASLNTFVLEALRGDEDDDEESLAARLVKEQLAYLANMVVGLREAQSVINGFDYTGPAGGRGFSVLSQFIKQSKQIGAALADGGDVGKTFDRAFAKSAFDAAGVLFHLPTTQAFRTIEGAIALMDDETDNPMALLLGPPREKR